MNISNLQHVGYTIRKRTDNLCHCLKYPFGREAKSKGEKERYKHLNAEFQRIAEEIRKPSSATNAKK